MTIRILRDTKTDEHRVSVTLASVRELSTGASVSVGFRTGQSGCLQGQRSTSHTEPTVAVERSQYCVATMPGALPRTPTHAPASSALPYVRSLAAWGRWEAARRAPGTADCANVMDRDGVHDEVAAAFGAPAARTA